MPRGRGMEARTSPMTIAVAAPLAGSVLLYSAVSKTTTYRRCEKVALAYFAYMAVVLSFHTVPTYRYSLALLIPFLLAAAVALEARYSVPWSSVLRDWAPLGLILLAYREVEWFSGKPALTDLERIWVRWDHAILYDAGFRAALESAGSFIPSLLEITYLLLYALPLACMASALLVRTAQPHRSIPYNAIRRRFLRVRLITLLSNQAAEDRISSRRLRGDGKFLASDQYMVV